MKKNILIILLCFPFFCFSHEKSKFIDELESFHDFAVKNKTLNKYETQSSLKYPKYNFLKEYKVKFNDNLNDYFVTANPETGKISYYDVVINKNIKCNKASLENISKENIYKNFIVTRKNKKFIEKTNYNNEKVYFLCRKNKGTVVEFEMNKRYY